MIQEPNQAVSCFFQRSTGVSGTGYDSVIRKSLNGTQLVVRRDKADGRHADGTEFIKSGSARGNAQITPAHKGGHILYVSMNMNGGMVQSNLLQFVKMRIEAACDNMIVQFFQKTRGIVAV